MRNTFIKLFICFDIFILLDQITKYFAQKNQNTLEIIGDFLKIEYSQNSGIAFGIQLYKPLLIVISIALLIFLIRFGAKELNLKKNLSIISISLVLAGGIGNLIDRLFRGYVIDFISIWEYPNFNFADAYIVLGILSIVLFYGKLKKPSGEI